MTYERMPCRVTDDPSYDPDYEQWTTDDEQDGIDAYKEKRETFSRFYAYAVEERKKAGKRLRLQDLLAEWETDNGIE